MWLYRIGTKILLPPASFSVVELQQKCQTGESKYDRCCVAKTVIQSKFFNSNVTDINNLHVMTAEIILKSSG